MSRKKTIWVVDDERIVRVTLADDLRDAGFVVMEFANANSALLELNDSIPDIIITDLKMPGLTGLELLNQVKSRYPQIFIIVMTAYGTVENAVEAMKMGAYDYLTKPFNNDEVLITINKIIELCEIRKENRVLRKQINENYDFSRYIGNLESNKNLFDQIKLIARKDSTILVTGETGTGKELITNIIHYNSTRKHKPIIKVSCAILSREIFESELFGHVKGAFTGADSEKIGRFEAADKGTLYLDDIDDIPFDLQVKLLRVIEQREVEKVGSSSSIPVDVRIIASTKKDLKELVQEGKFREDLFYRLNVFPINLAPLRERKKDISGIFSYYFEKYSGHSKIELDDEIISLLEDYNWHGNVRELKNIAERLAIIVNDGKLRLEDMPIEIQNHQELDICSKIGNKPLDKILADIEVDSIMCALKRSKYNKKKAAEILGIPPSTLRTKMNKYDIE